MSDASASHRLRGGLGDDSLRRLRSLSEYHEDFGAVLWWFFPLSEPPYVGSPLDSDWPGYHTHWTQFAEPLIGIVPAPDDPEEYGDSVVEAVRADLLERSRVGLLKYGVTLARTDLNLRDWLQHLYEELLDAANYAKRAIMEIDWHGKDLDP